MFEVLVALKLGVSQATANEHMKSLRQAGLMRAERIKQWTFYTRDETQIEKLKERILGCVEQDQYLRTTEKHTRRTGEYWGE